MSSIRVYDGDGRPTWRKADDGAVGRITHSRYAIRGGSGNPVVYGSYPIGESDAEKHRRQNRDYKARQR